MQFPSRTLQQLLVLSVAILVPVECACIPVSLPALTTSSAAASSTALTPVPIQLEDAAVKTSITVSSSTRATPTPTSSPLAVRPVYVAQKTTSSSASKSTTTSASKVNARRSIVESRHTAAGRDILRKQAEAEQALRAAAEESLKATASTLKFGSTKTADLLHNVTFGKPSPKAAKGLISNLRLSVSSAIKPLVKTLAFKQSAEPATARLQFGINRERSQQTL
ncbi:protein of unknown function [Taphrina deformans PYCC 5710]|uniref:Uncharacterized protein n=1 Tax=Taphrina deformans (strain PYCC 5710 / ATCC 11124 / CBS 356.35 / IMI 108563 / JCM 9778 / NBRC 8474) TaxID=1097556 RepID=R4XE89_TAPDE|nr:protein of unknown function [Taphrina deformans PYCC 5710]|eukprot:CCG83987.1 protein of unknown function [Taphrina deformans PYCC 5710]